MNLISGYINLNKIPIFSEKEVNSRLDYHIFITDYIVF